jgi:hypothetical protein
LPLEGEKNHGVSKTIPDQSMSIPELIRRYSSGLPLGGSKVPIYTGEEDILQGTDFNKLDLSEKHEFLRSIKQEYNETVNRLRNGKPQDHPAKGDDGRSNTSTESNEG